MDVGASRAPWRGIGAIAVSTFVLALLVLALGADLSSARYFHDDLLVRSAPSARPLPYRYLDASPWSIWVPSDLHIQASWRSGQVPFWNRTQGGGYSPFSINYPGALHPFRALSSLVPLGTAPTVLIVWAAGAMLAGGFGLLTSLGLSTLPALTGSAVFVGSPLMWGMWGFDFSLVLMFLPFLAWAAIVATRAPSFGSVSRLALVSALALVSGHPSMVFLAHLTAGLVVLSEALVTSKLRRLLPPLIGVVLGAFLAAPALVPFAQALTTGWTYKTSGAVTFGYEALSWPDWLEAIHALVIGTRDPMVDHVRFYAQLGPLLLGLAGVGLLVARRQPSHRFLLVLVPATVILSLPPPFMSFLSHAPGLGHLKIWYVFPACAFSLGLAAGVGLEGLFERVRSAWARLVLGVAASMLALSNGAARAPDLHAPRAQLILPADAPALSFLRAQEGPFRVMSVGGHVNAPNVSFVTQVEDLGLSSPLLPLRYDAWFNAVDPKSHENSFPTIRITGRLDVSYLGAFNVRYLLNGKRPFGLLHSQLDPRDPFGIVPARRVSREGWPLVYEDSFVQIFENREHYRARAYLSDAARAVPDLRSAVDAIRSSPHESVDVVETSDPTQISALATTSSTAGRITQLSYPADSEALLEVALDRPSLLVLAESFDEGWGVRVDGASASLLPVNVLSRGVWVPAGTHQIHMSYVPPGLSLGCLLSAATLILMLASRRRFRAS
ncbi:MAG: hypothetical protein HYV07_00625 [Deltaproteobacteria bacterium]|nr:hypothetical protein [Deltaproteobacteria bacterium]